MESSGRPVHTSGDAATTRSAKAEISRLAERWMGLLFPRQTDLSVLGKWRPRTLIGRLEYRGWWLLGLPIITGLYVVALIGTPIRYAVRHISLMGERIGFAGIVGLAGVFAVSATGVTWFWLPIAGVVAVGVAAVFTTLTVVGVVFSVWYGGRATTILLAYPLGLLAIILIPGTAYAYSTGRINLHWPAALDTVLSLPSSVPPLSVVITGSLPSHLIVSEAALWLGMVAVAGWGIGMLVLVTDVVRP